MDQSTRRAEVAVAICITCAAILLHAYGAVSAGPLWRDEANTIGLATLPTLQDVWANLQFDSFPLLWILIVRQAARIFGTMNDVAFRAIGFTVGAGVVAMLWLSARTLNRSVPLISLLLLGLAPSFILWGGSIRAYGFGMMLIILTVSLLWRFVMRPGRATWAAAALAALASVHALYYNSVLLLAFGCGAIAVCARHKQWRQALAIAAIGLISAVSLLPYLEVISAASTWNVLVQMPDYTFGWFLRMLYETTRPGGFWMPVVWAEFFILALVVAVQAIRSDNGSTRLSLDHDVTLFAGTALVVGSVGLFVFLNTLSYITAPWYYLPMLTLVAVSVDAISGARVRNPRPRQMRLIVVLVLAIATIPPSVRSVGMRRTNVDVIASQLRQSAKPGDVVLVNVWYYGVSFNRYYDGAAPWMTIPPIGFHRFHRYDLTKQRMGLSDQTLAVSAAVSAASASLRRGDRVFIVGYLPFPQVADAPRALPAGPLPGAGWAEDAYHAQWGAMVGYYLRRHAGRISEVAVSPPGHVSDYENLGLTIVEGWRP